MVILQSIISPGSLPSLTGTGHRLSLNRTVLFGGGAANIATGIARLGGNVTLVSAVGEDFAGSDYEAWLKENGVLLRIATRFWETIRQQHSCSPIPPETRSRSLNGGLLKFSGHPIPRPFLSSTWPLLTLYLMSKVAEKAGFASFDPGQDLHRYSAEQLHSIISRASLLFANHHEVEGMCRMIEHFTEQHSSTMVPMAVFTRGARGSTLYYGGRRGAYSCNPGEDGRPYRGWRCLPGRVPHCISEGLPPGCLLQDWLCCGIVCCGSCGMPDKSSRLGDDGVSDTRIILDRW